MYTCICINLYVYMYACITICMYVYSYTCINIHTIYIYIYMCTQIVFISLSLSLYIYIYIYVYIRKERHTMFTSFQCDIPEVWLCRLGLSGAGVVLEPS